MAHDVFISYSVKDRLAADALCHKLEEDSIRCWIAPRDISPGGSWAGEIANAIPESRIMLLVFSSNSNSSKQVLREVELAITSNLTIIPLKIEDTSPTGGMSYYLSTTHWIDAIGNKFDKRINTLSQKIQAMLGIEETKEKPDDKQGSAKQQTNISAIARKPEPEKNAKLSPGKKTKTKNVEKWFLIGFLSLIILIAAGYFIYNQFLSGIFIAEVTDSPPPTRTWKTIPNKTAEPPAAYDEYDETRSDVFQLSEIPIKNAEELGYDKSREVNFEDVNLREVIKDTLIATVGDEMSDDTLTIEDILQLRYLVLVKQDNLSEIQEYDFSELTESGMGYDVIAITSPETLISLNGLQYAHNLLAIYVIGYDIEDFSPISNLESLRIMHLSTGEYIEPGTFELLNNIRQLHIEAEMPPHMLLNIPSMENLMDLSLTFSSRRGIRIDEFEEEGLSMDDALAVFEGNESIRSLSLNNMMISDIGSMKDMKYLTDLNLANNLIYDLSPLDNHSELESLMLYNNQITSITTFPNLKKLNYLNLEFNPLENIQGLVHLENLNELYIDFSVYYSNPLDILNQLKYNGCAVYTRTKHPAEYGYDMMTQVNVTNTDIKEGIKANLRNAGYEVGQELTIMDLFRLDNLIIKRDGHFDENWLQGMPVKFNHLNIIACEGDVDLSFLEYAHNLKLLVADGYGIDDISFLSGLENLLYIAMESNEITDISALANHDALHYFIMNGNNISDIRPIFEGSRSIHFVMLDHNLIQDLTPIEYCVSENFHHLHISNNNVTDISPLEKHIELRILDFSRNDIKDLSVLRNMEKLMELVVDNSTASMNQTILEEIAERGCNIDIVNDDE